MVPRGRRLRIKHPQRVWKSIRPGRRRRTRRVPRGQGRGNQKSSGDVEGGLDLRIKRFDCGLFYKMIRIVENQNPAAKAMISVPRTHRGPTPPTPPTAHTKTICQCHAFTTYPRLGFSIVTAYGFGSARLVGLVSGFYG